MKCFTTYIPKTYKINRKPYHKDCEGDHGDNYNDYNKPNISEVAETAFTTPSFTDKQSISNFQDIQKLKRNELAELHKNLGFVTGDLDLINLDQFRYENLSEKGAQF